MKKDIAPFKDGLAILRQVNPITYKFNGIGDLPTSKTNIGVIAQDVQQFAPYCIGTGNLVINHSDATQNFSSDIVTSLSPDSSGTARDLVKALTYNYDGVIYVIINSVKEIDSTVTDLQTKLIVNAGLRTIQPNNESSSLQEIKQLKKENEELKKEFIALKKRIEDLEKNK